MYQNAECLSYNVEYTPYNKNKDNGFISPRPALHSPGPSCKCRLISGQQVWRRGISHGGVAKSILPVHPGQEPCRGSHSQLQPVFFSIPLSLYYYSLIYFTYPQALHSSANIVQPCPAEQPILRAEPRSNHPHIRASFWAVLSGLRRYTTVGSADFSSSFLLLLTSHCLFSFLLSSQEAIEPEPLLYHDS